MHSLADRVAIVTGASGALGSAAARELAGMGAKVVLNYNRNPTSAEALAGDIEGRAFAADVSTVEGAQALADFALEQFGRLDILVNNAGITRDGLALRMSEEDWDAVLDTNLKGAFLCARAALRPMLRQRWGRIINVSSVAGLIGNPGQANYSAAKAGMIGLTKSLAREVANRNVTVNAIAPGYVPSAIWDDVSEEAKAAILQQIPMRRTGTPAEVAAAIGFLASDRAAYITGQVLAIDGGLV
ncbi:MAG TPA: 3-oxoacyl-[acyl-carrier-protein] reductase [Chloroflexota bacterium]|nr:3-oxoacyl-[acyl-carrier-protein] reductase [Chloroflexota bacterium]